MELDDGHEDLMAGFKPRRDVIATEMVKSK